jgi:peptidoglycan/xylan/chitin deacetylase (PgdA/CDA1 family)
MYHELTAPGLPPADLDPGYRRYVVARDDFRAQLEQLTDSGFHGVSVSTFCSGAHDSRSAVVITFDDGCASDARIAAPELQDRGFTATSFVVTQWIGKPGFMAANEVREVHQMGMEIGSHSHTHRFLADLDDEQIEEELTVSKKTLEEIISAPVVHFSCPGGRYDQRVLRIAKQAGYRSVSTSAIGANKVRPDFSVFNREAIYANTDLRQFERICKGIGIGTRQLSYQLRAGVRSLLGNDRYQRLRSALLGPGETE